MIFKLGKEAIVLLIEGSKKAIPFNIILASLLALIIYPHVPFYLVSIWYCGILLISLIRWLFCRHIIKNKLYEVKKQYILITFFLLTLVIGIAWGSCYLISLPYVTELYEFIIILVLGGMSAGSIASLSAYLPAYYAYIFPMFLPVIIYNYSVLDIDRTILATMFSLFIVMLIVSARINKNLLDRTFQLSQDRESLIFELQLISITDPLTGLYNRRHFEVLFPQELERAKRNRYPLNLIFMDVDNFKLINDNFGHLYGDKFLIGIGELLNGVCQRANDTIFRLGGDEFAAILANQPLGEALSICRTISNQFRENLLHGDFNMNEQTILEQVTLSMGLVNIHFESSSNIETVISLADKALYQAKKGGKNQIIIEQLH
ncbi:two component response regulator with GGDEF domain [Legionella steigerwaltii]|uniref:diguanylate cyclase n=1 Tax=Legionella steigerwaltii TaxID=460 RepID=A0A378L8I2_9GAMM|nr:GGDEF domain-containing protein [Legionella steigerwaltii]KTD77724.1 two component response regulator with GGDEF domain protein [Legionella steigerwaltii]STY23034.1 two component response regulator with GGDEF domain [Legionella steigerwaltii]